MWQSGFTHGLEAIQRTMIGALIVALLVLLASCTGSGKFADGAPSGKIVPPVFIQQIQGLPPTKLAELKTAMAVAGGQRAIGLVEGQTQQGTVSLTGDFQALTESAGVRIVYQWQLRDWQGTLIQTIDDEENAGLITGADPWAAVSSSVIDRIARRSAESMAKRLSEMGYATRVAALHVPPAEYFAMAGPDAQREVDFETLNGPGMAMAGMDMVAPPPPTDMPDVEPIPGEAQVAAAPEAAPSTPSRQTAATDAEIAAPAPDGAAGKVAIRAVAVMPVKGSPGGGDAELTAAMRRTLAAAGWPVVTKRQPDALTIVGRVKIGGLVGSQQSVSVRWEVQSPDGKTLGDVKQANQVPSGSLDRGWGQAAFAVAEAAATGIFDIVNRFQ